MKTKLLGLFLPLHTLGLRLPVAPLLAGTTAKALAAMSGQETLETIVNSEDRPLYFTLQSYQE